MTQRAIYLNAGVIRRPGNKCNLVSGPEVSAHKGVASFHRSNLFFFRRQNLPDAVTRSKVVLKVVDGVSASLTNSTLLRALARP